MHAELSIPNFDNGNERILEEGMIIAVEPFASTGVGRVIEGKPAGVYMLIKSKPVRDNNARKLLSYIQKEFRTLPFSVRWVKHFPNYNFALGILEREGILKQYNQLPEESKGIVSQTEHTFRVGQGQLT